MVQQRRKQVRRGGDKLALKGQKKGKRRTGLGMMYLSFVVVACCTVVVLPLFRGPHRRRHLHRGASGGREMRGPRIPKRRRQGLLGDEDESPDGLDVADEYENATAAAPVKVKLERFRRFREQPLRPQLHDQTSLTSIIFYRGNRWTGNKDERPPVATFNFSDTVIDTVSVGSTERKDYILGQVKSWGAHRSIRYFFGTSEEDNAQPKCVERLSVNDTAAIAEYCSGKAWKRANPKIRYIRNPFARGELLKKHEKGPNWMCSHKSFAHALGKVARFYRKEMAAGEFELPDFLFIQEDDTYYNMHNMDYFLQDADPNRALAEAGCLVRWPVSEIMFSYPFGGYGFVLSRGAIERMLRPLHCNPSTGEAGGDDAFEKFVCEQLAENLVGENFAWQDGMSVSDLMDAHAAYYPFHRYSKWRQPGFCLHGDWVLGFYTNYYGLGTPHSYFKHDKIRIEQSLGYMYDQSEGNCNNVGQAHCDMDAHVCRQIHPTSMTFLARKLLKTNPEDFVHHIH